MSMYPIQEVEFAKMVFPANVLDMMPPYQEIPDEFKRSSNPWARIVSAWFFKGFDTRRLTPKEGIDKQKALCHIRTVLGSWEPKHEHKEAGCAFLLNEWFEPLEAEPAPRD